MEVLDYSIDTSTKTLFLDRSGDSEDIDPGTVGHYIKCLHILDKIKPSSDLVIIMNSRGGHVEDGLALYSAIRDCDSYVHIHVAGAAESMSSVILQAGDKRTMADTAHLMLHEGTDAAAGHPEDIKRQLAHSEWLEDRCLDIYLRRIREKKPKYSKAALQSLIKFDKYFYREQALSWNLIDE